MNYDAMTIDELVTAQQAIDAERNALKLQAAAIQRVIDQKTAAETADRVLARLGDAEKMALLQQLQTQGIASGEVVKGASVQ